jgi:hypothetical protein
LSGGHERVEDRVLERVLVLNPGTTSTKLGVFTRAGEEMARNIHHGDEEIERFRGRPILDRLEYRVARIESALSEAGIHSERQRHGVLGGGGRTGRAAAADGLRDVSCGRHDGGGIAAGATRRTCVEPGRGGGAQVCNGGRREGVHCGPGDGGRVAGVCEAFRLTAGEADVYSGMR